MGRSGQAVGDDLLAYINDRVDARFMVGIYNPGLGWVLGLGSSGKLCINAVVGHDGICAFSHGAKKKRNVSHVEYPYNNIWIHTGAAWNVYQPWWPCPLCSFFCGINYGVDFSSIHGANAISCIDVVCP